MAAEEAAAAGAGDDSGSEVEELSDAEKARVAAHFVVSSPPGQIGDVVGGECRRARVMLVVLVLVRAVPLSFACLRTARLWRRT